mmetsp:Transcript_98042/g.277625  ORF Transcript_98042/g.277625 Transcript_98042/m.277625 type:complete len:247 (+) Transcript_98042:85-825(+)
MRSMPSAAPLGVFVALILCRHGACLRADPSRRATAIRPLTEEEQVKSVLANLAEAISTVTGKTLDGALADAVASDAAHEALRQVTEPRVVRIHWKVHHEEAGLGLRFKVDRHCNSGGKPAGACQIDEPTELLGTEYSCSVPLLGPEARIHTDTKFTVFGGYNYTMSSDCAFCGQDCSLVTPLGAQSHVIPAPACPFPAATFVGKIPHINFDHVPEFVKVHAEITVVLYRAVSSKDVMANFTLGVSF